MARASRFVATLCLVIVACCFIESAMSQAAAPLKKASFYQALVDDAANHKMILDAINKDAATKNLLKLPLNVTAFVPTDKAFRKAAQKFGINANDTSKLMANTCLINALLRYHIITPGMKTDKLKKLAAQPAPANRKNTMLMVATANPLKKETKALTFSVDKKNGYLRISGGASSAYAGSPKNVIAGKGIMTNIDTVLLPSADIAVLSKMTGCKIQL